MDLNYIVHMLSEAKIDDIKRGHKNKGHQNVDDVINRAAKANKEGAKINLTGDFGGIQKQVEEHEAKKANRSELKPIHSENGVDIRHIPNKESCISNYGHGRTSWCIAATGKGNEFNNYEGRRKNKVYAIHHGDNIYAWHEQEMKIRDKNDKEVEFSNLHPDVQKAIANYGHGADSEEGHTGHKTAMLMASAVNKNPYLKMNDDLVEKASTHPDSAFRLGSAENYKSVAKSILEKRSETNPHVVRVIAQNHPDLVEKYGLHQHKNAIIRQGAAAHPQFAKGLLKDRSANVRLTAQETLQQKPSNLSEEKIMHTKKLVTFIKESARNRNLRTLDYILNESFLIEEKVEGGAGSDLRGETSEAALHYSIANYLTQRNKGKTHEEAIEHLMTPKHHETLLKQLEDHPSNRVLRGNEHIGNLDYDGKFQGRNNTLHNQYKHVHIDNMKENGLSLEPNRKIQDHMNTKEDFENTVKDATHGAVHYINHLVSRHGPLEGTHHLTGPIGEIETARRIGATNADLVVSVKKKNGTGNELMTVPRGNSLKYETDKTNTIKVRTPGEQPFHNAVSKLLNSSGRDTTELERLHKNLQNERALISPQEKKPKDWNEEENGTWKQNPIHLGVNEKFQSVADQIEKRTKKRPTTLAEAKSTLRKIHRRENGGVQITSSNANTNHWSHQAYKTLNDIEQPTKDARIKYNKHVAEQLNSVYQDHASAGDNQKPALSTAINKFHRELSGIVHRKRKWVNILSRSGHKIKASVVPTVLMKISRNKKTTGTNYEPPSIKIHSLSNMLEKTERRTGRWSANSTDGGGITINAHDEHGDSTPVFRTSLDKDRGHIVSMVSNTLRKLRKK